MKNKLIISAVILITSLAIGLTVYHPSPALGQQASFLLLTGAGDKFIKPVNNLWGLQWPGLATSTTGCLAVASGGWISASGLACGSGGGGGSGGGTWATTTSTHAGRLINYPLNDTDIVTVGATATTSAEFYFDPNLQFAKIPYATTTFLTITSGFLSQASSTNVGAFTVGGKLTFPYSSSTIYSSFLTASTTNLIVNGESVNNLAGTNLTITSGALNLDNPVVANLTGNVTGNADTATALAANAANCSAGQAAGGVTAAGAAEDCTTYLTSTFSFPFTVVTGYNSTSTPIGFLNGMFSTASSTFSGPVLMPALSVGTLNVGTNGLLYSGATTTFGSGFATTTRNFVTFSTSTLVFNGLTVGQNIVPTVGALTFTPTITGTLDNGGLTNSTISGIALGGTLANLTATDATLTFSGTYTGATARTIGLNLGNGNTWTALQKFFANASSTGFSANYGAIGGTATTTITADGRIGIGTSTPQWQLSIASTTGPQIALQGASTDPHWVIRGVADKFYIATASPTTYATSTPSPLTISSSGFGTTTLLGLNISGLATSTSNVGYNITTGCYAVSGTCISGGAAGSGDITSVGDVASGAAFDGTQGTILTFNNAGGDQTLDYDGTDFNFSNALDIVGTTTVTAAAGSRAYLLLGTTSPIYAYASEYLADFGGDDNDFLSVNIFNNNPGPCATADISMNNNLADITTDFADLGHTSSGYTGVGCSALSTPMTGLMGNQTYLFDPSGSMSFLLGSTSPTTYMNWFTGGYAAGNEKMRLTSAGNFLIGTTTSSNVNYSEVIASSTAPQLALSAGAGQAQWTFRNAGSNFYLSTSSVSGLSTTSISALEIAGNGFGTTTIRGLNISGAQATSTSNVGFNITNGCYAIAGACLSTSGGSSFGYPFTNPLAGFSATTSSMIFGTSTSYLYTLTLASSTAPQVALSAGAGIAEWTMRNAGGNLYLSTTTVAGLATTSISALEVSGVGFGTTTLRGLNISGGQATSTSNVGFNITGGCYAISSTCLPAPNAPGGTGTELQFRGGASTFSAVTSSAYTTAGSFLGIGTTTPAFLLQVATTSTAGFRPQLSLTDITGPVGGKHWYMSSLNGVFELGTTSDTTYATSTALRVSPTTDATTQVIYGSSTPSTSWLPTMAINNFAGKDSLAIGSTTGHYLLLDKSGHLFLPKLTQSGANQTYYMCGAATTFEAIWDTTVCLVSAAKFKTNIEPLDIGLAELLKIRPVEFNYKPSGNPDYDNNINIKHQQIGLIADEVEKIDTRLISYDSSGDIHGFNYEQFTAWITKAIQDFYGEFQKLVARVSGLENKVDNQQKQIDELRAEINNLKGK